MIEGLPALSDLPLSAFIRPAVVCHVPRKGPGELIHGDELAAHCPPVQPGDALLIECGWGSRWGEPDYVTAGPAYHHDCPHLAAGAAVRHPGRGCAVHRKRPLAARRFRTNRQHARTAV